jgi:hypothetical protein
MNYTEEDVHDYIVNTLVIKKSRKQDYLDVRNYLLAILYYNFKHTEEELQFIYKIDRSTINVSKKNPYHLLKLNDYDFLKHTEEVRLKFPYVFPEPSTKSKLKHRKKTTISLNNMVYGQVKIFAEKNDMYLHTAIRLLIKRGLEWVE